MEVEKISFCEEDKHLVKKKCLQYIQEADIQVSLSGEIHVIGSGCGKLVSLTLFTIARGRYSRIVTLLLPRFHEAAKSGLNVSFNLEFRRTKNLNGDNSTEIGLERNGNRACIAKCHLNERPKKRNSVPEISIVFSGKSLSFNGRVL